MAEEFPRGQLSTIILMCLKETDKYGYEIIDEVLKKTDGKLSIKQPSLYSSLKRMEEQSLISSYWRDSEIGGRRHYYHLTDLGKKHLEKWQTNITLPINNPNSSAKFETKVLQQANLFNLNTITQNNKNENSNIIKTNTFIQSNLFSNEQSITPPDTSQENQNEVISNQISITEQILQNDKNNFILTSPEQPQEVKIKKFDYVKRNNKSFSDSIKNINSFQTRRFNLIRTDINSTRLNEINNNLINKEDETTTKSLEYDNKIIEETTNNTLNINTEKSVNFNKNIEEPFDTTNNDETKESIDIQSSETVFQNPSQKVDINSLDGYVRSIKNHGNSSSESIPNQNNNVYIQKEHASSINEQVSTKKDDAVFITERLDIKDIPKPPKWDARKFEIYLSDNSITPKLERKTNETYEDRVKELYEKSKANAENQKLELIETKVNFSSYQDLKDFYADQNIKFKPYEKKLYKSEKNFDMIKINKLNLYTSLLLFIGITILSISFAIIFSFVKEAQLNIALTFITFPALALLHFLYNFIVFTRSPQKKVAYNVNKFKFNINIMFLSLLFVPFVFAINIFFGFDFNNFAQYSLTLTYPYILSLVYPIYYLSQKILTKLKFLY